MTAQEIVARYYDAWQTKSGDLTDVPSSAASRSTTPRSCAERWRSGTYESGGHPGGHGASRGWSLVGCGAAAVCLVSGLGVSTARPP
jgi:hypothetical protein